MNHDILKSRWMLLKGEIKKKWGDLTDDEITKIEGQEDILLGKLQDRYGYSKEIARNKLNEFLKELKLFN